MNRDSCQHVQERLWQYIDREFSAPVLIEISSHLKSCEACRQVYESRARDANLYRMAFLGSPFGDGFVKRFHDRLGSERLGVEGIEASRLDPSVADWFADVAPDGAPDPALRRADGSPSASGDLAEDGLDIRDLDEGGYPRGEPWRESPAPAGSFADGERGGTQSGRRHGLVGQLRSVVGRFAWGLVGVAVAVAAFLAFDRPEEPVAHVAAAVGVSVMRDGQTASGNVADARAGDEFVLEAATSRVAFALRDGTDLALEGPGRFRIEASSSSRGPFRAYLTAGMLRARVSKRSLDRQLRVTTPHATAVVVGTVFTLSVVEASRTTLSVEEGEVRFLGTLGLQSQAVTADTGPFEVTTGYGRPRSLAARPASLAESEPAMSIDDSPATPGAAVDTPSPAPRGVPVPRGEDGGQDLPHEERR